MVGLVVLLVGVFGYIGFVDLYNLNLLYLLCLFKLFMGWNCFVCGGLWMIYDLLYGELVVSINDNVFLFVGVLVLVSWVLLCCCYGDLVFLILVMIVVVVVVIVWMVLCNLLGFLLVLMISG